MARLLAQLRPFLTPGRARHTRAAKLFDTFLMLFVGHISRTFVFTGFSFAARSNGFSFKAIRVRKLPVTSYDCEQLRRARKSPAFLSLRARAPIYARLKMFFQASVAKLKFELILKVYKLAKFKAVLEFSPWKRHKLVATCRQLRTNFSISSSCRKCC